MVLAALKECLFDYLLIAILCNVGMLDLGLGDSGPLQYYSN